MNSKRKPGAGSRRLGYGLLAGAACCALPALAVDFNINDDHWGDFRFSLNNRLTVGAAVRVKSRNYDIIDKQNVPGQATLCANPPANSAPGVSVNGDCESFGGDPAPSRVLLDARGGYNPNGDDGDLNYSPGSITYSGASLRSTLSGSWRNFDFKVGGIGIYDPVNSNFNTHFRNLAYPGRVSLNSNVNDSTTILLQRPERRAADLESSMGDRTQLLEAYISGSFEPLHDHHLNLAVGKQYLRWGESTFMLFNNLNQINPLSAPLYRFPGSEVKDAFLPTNLITASFDLLPKVTLSGFYQLAWEPTEPDVAGSYMSVSNVANAGNGPTPIYLGSFSPEDPLGQFQPASEDSPYVLGSRTAYLLGPHYGDPHNGGQFGFRLDTYLDWLNGGTELSFYGMNIHSRLPYFSAYAAEKSCFDAAAFYQAGMSAAFAPCATMYGIHSPTTIGPQFDAARLHTFPINTMRPFLEYPEDIHIMGMSFNTTAGNWSLAGEATYSPNQPAQVSVVDVAYAALQPAFPDTPPGYGYGQGNPPSVFGGARGWFGSGTIIPTNQVFIPDYLETQYRHHKVQAGDYVQGYERLQVAQLDLTAIRIFSGSNWIRANQILFVGEVAGIKVFNMPERHSLQFEGGTGRETHYSVGNSEWTPTEPCAGTYANNYLDGCINQLDVANPERASGKDFADSFAWGYRFRLNATYDDVWHGIGMTPGVEVWHDVMGTSISPGQDFVQGRIQATYSNEFKFSQNFTGLLRYAMFAGAGYRNVRNDRDYAEMSFTYSF